MRRRYIVVCAILGAAACNDATYLAAPRALETLPGMDGEYVDDTLEFTLPIRPPNADDKYKMSEERRIKMLPMDVPWIGVRDMPLQVQVRVTNLDDQATAHAHLTLLGGNEFGRYDPTLFYDPNDPEALPPPPLTGDRPIEIAPGQSKDLLIREDQIAEAAVDMEAIVRFPSDPPESTPYKVLIGRSDVSKTGLESVPAGDVTPQLLTLIFHLTSDTHTSATLMMRVRDLEDRLAEPGATDLYR